MGRRVLATMCVVLALMLSACGGPEKDASGRVEPSHDVVWDLIKHDGFHGLIDHGTVPGDDDLGVLPATPKARLAFVLTDVVWAAPDDADTWSAVWDSIKGVLGAGPDAYQRLIEALSGASKTVPPMMAQRMSRDLGSYDDEVRASLSGESATPSAVDTLRALSALGDEDAFGGMAGGALGVLARDVGGANSPAAARAALRTAVADWVRPDALVQAGLGARPAAMNAGARSKLVAAIEDQLEDTYRSPAYHALPIETVPKALRRPGGQRLEDVDPLHERAVDAMLAANGLDFHEVAAGAVSDALSAVGGRSGE